MEDDKRDHRELQSIQGPMPFRDALRYLVFFFLNSPKDLKIKIISPLQLSLASPWNPYFCRSNTPYIKF